MPMPIDEKRIRWEDIAPNFSIKIFQLANDAKQWTSDSVTLTEKLASVIPHLCPAYNKKLTAATTPGVKLLPQNVKIIQGVFFDASKNTLEKVETVDDQNASIIIDPNLLSENHIFVGGFCFEVSGSPGWLKRDRKELVDIKNHLAFFFILPPYVGITCTHEGLHNYLGEFLELGQVESITLPSVLQPIPQKDFENAFIKGEAYYLWLQGLHKSTPTKADKKMLSGPDLRQALDPFGENSYTYNAVMSSIDKSKLPKILMDDSKRERSVKSIGYSRLTQTVWMTKTYGVLEFAKRLAFIRNELTHSKTISPKDAAILASSRLGLNYLSKPISGQLIDEVDSPFEISLNLSDPGENGYPSHDLSDAQDEWRTHGHLQITKFDKPTLNLTVQALYDWKPITEFVIELSRSPEGISGIILKDITDPKNEDLKEHEQLQKIIQEKGLNNSFNIRFESGHILSGIQLFKPEYQDFIFNEWTSLDLQNTNFWEEKPEDWIKLDEIGKTKQIRIGKSLFSYVATNIVKLINPAKGSKWFLLCHDQSQEIADFIYIEPENRRIELIHVKGAESKSNNRRVSIDAYQVVCAQAVKNLRHLNANLLVERFIKYFKKSGPNDPSRCGHFLVSYKKPTLITEDCSEFITGLKLINQKLPTLKKKVIVFQPHIQKTKWNDIYDKFNNKNNGTSKSSLRPASMLTTILYETKLSCIKQGVEFEIWNDNS